MGLISQNTVAQLPTSDWRRVAHDDIAERLTAPSDFPCTFSQNAFRRELIQYSFVDQADEEGFANAMRDLEGYVADCRTWDGRVDSAKPMLMVFSETCASLAEYYALGWSALQHWHEHDPAGWPEDVSTDPTTPYWSFCWGGMQLFVNMSAPLHKMRKSRNLGRYFVLVINPRERFDIVAGNMPEGQKMRAKIRARSEAYDGMPHSPLLGSYQKGELEWVQYALNEDNLAPELCPFRFDEKG